MQAACSTRVKHSPRQPSIAVEPALVASKQTAVEFVSAARQDAGAPDIRMVGIEENICV
jgi:hypothetical protein